MDQYQRTKYIIELYQKLNPEEEVSALTTIKNASIEKICMYDGGAYQRIKTWLESTIGKKLKETQEVSDDAKLFKEQLINCYNLMVSRNEKYGNSWKKLRVEGMIDLMAMKLDRCQKQELNVESLEVEIEDIINYGIFCLTKLRNK